MWSLPNDSATKQSSWLSLTKDNGLWEPISGGAETAEAAPKPRPCPGPGPDPLLLEKTGI